MRLLALLLLLATPVWADCKIINKRGQKVEVQRSLIQDKTCYVLYHADSIFLSRQLVASVMRYAPSHPQTEFLVVDVNDLSSPAARQYHLTNLPYVQVYNGKGELQSEGAPAYQALNKMLESK